MVETPKLPKTRKRQTARARPLKTATDSAEAVLHAAADAAAKHDLDGVERAAKVAERMAAAILKVAEARHHTDRTLGAAAEPSAERGAEGLLLRFARLRAAAEEMELADLAAIGWTDPTLS